MSKKKRLKELEESYEYGIINKEEYLKKKKEIEEGEEEIKPGEKKESENLSRSSDKILIIGIVILILLFVVVFFITRITKEQPKTIEDLHRLNIQGKLKPEQGYLYKGAYSFVNLDGFWYTQLTSPSGKSLYNMALRYGPRDLENIRIFGYLNNSLFNEATDYYVTFNPTGNDFSHVALAVSDFNQHMEKVFGKTPIAACDKNETAACEDRPIINCDNTDKVVLYVKEANQSLVKYDNNCIIVEGKNFDLVKGIDRILLNFYGIMGQ
jgi:hypothetical protein